MDGTMGKKAKKKNGRTPTKEKRVSSSSPRKVPQRSSTTVEIADDDVSVVKENSLCGHIDKCFNLNELSSKLGSSEPISCEDCQESSADRRGSKGKARHGKKKGGTSVDGKADSKAIWICLQCGHYACGGIGLPTNSQSHAVRHVRQTRHPVVIQFENPQLRWCFSCNTLLPVEKTEENGEQKDGLSNVVKLIRDQSMEASPVDVVNTWQASSDVTAATKSESSILSDLDRRNHYVVKGLINLGNTCFFNSILQNLLAIDLLRDHLLKLEECVGPLTIALKIIFTEARMEGRMKGSINPRSVFGCISTKAPQFKGYEQHDSHELLRVLLDGLSTEELASRKTKKSKEEIISRNPTPTFVDEMFGGQISSAVCCKECGHTSTVYEPFLDLSLPVPMKKSLAKKVQPVSRTKKSKGPPKRSGKTHPKTYKGSDVVPVQIASVPSSGNESSLQSEASASGTTIIMEKTSSSQNVSDVKESEKEVETENGGECTSDALTWMDFLGPEPNAETYDISTTQDSDKNVEVFISDDSQQSICGPSMPVSSLHNEPNQRPDFSPADSWDDESPLQVQASDVLLLPYQEESSTAEVAKEDDQASSSVLGCAQNDFDGFGLGDMFDEPEVIMGPIARPSTGNEVLESSFISESEPEEVDNTDSPVSVESCLTYFTKPELLSNENGYNCEKCSKRVQQQRLEMKKQSKVASSAVENGYETAVRGDISCLDKNTSVEVKNQRNMNLVNGSVSYNSGESSNLKENVDCSSQDCTKPVNCKTDSLVLDADEAMVDGDMNPGLAHSSGCNNTSSQECSGDKPSCSLSNDDPKGGGCPQSNTKPFSSQICAENSESEKGEEGEMDSDSTIVNVKRDATKRFLIHKAPPILTIHIKRFCPDARGRYSKLNGHVRFKETIDLKPYMDTRCTDREKYNYRLVGVVEHSGSMRGGHYVAYVRGGNRRRSSSGEAEEGASVWYYANDASVNEVTLDRVLGCDAYILFYEIT
ncbi:ubiquitin carboxyl-terminal hydrolase 2-like isoform X1 [Cucurbita moschata]|uniref:Ubiquitin carboxyl-terminal hydrolase n=2 Tax=Cucurbita moschata TaxID=3662 RepID=A0A6J1FBM3_CUCMO|nr:ubiquitin carboxyl-terminal hydrolase 2-like isoform X1 [Cucurbita moschata]XP_022935831.1 ubiquitin carboxyl-terminal hydrolase 2-like isoform X1 [Cucurbita moschata]XP_022935838.1 ubiquitin carboxyl-terminal hydrolase 2-like isoform X1 [Cucurbita moschata]